MFKRLENSSDSTVEIFLDGEAVDVPAGVSVAAALLSIGRTFRFVGKEEVARGPYCMMGICFDCLVTIDGVSNRQACMVEVAAGMAVMRQRGVIGGIE